MKVVVGTKKDTLDQATREISIEEAIKFSHEINEGIDLSALQGDPYFETSAKTGHNVENVFKYMFEYCLPLGGTNPRKSDAQASTVNLHSDTAPQKRGCCG